MYPDRHVKEKWLLHRSCEGWDKRCISVVFVWIHDECFEFFLFSRDSFIVVIVFGSRRQCQAFEQTFLPVPRHGGIRADNLMLLHGMIELYAIKRV